MEDRGDLSAFSAVLDRHDQCRKCSVPVVSTLVGPIGLGLQSVKQWGDLQARPLVYVRGK
jgi:hypothetical protein